MIELKDDRLAVTFPEVHPEARIWITFHRTLRLPDDGNTYPTPSGLGHFPLRHLDDHADRLPEAWRRRGGVLMPMWRSEALWIGLEANRVENRGAYPFAVKVAAGKVCAVSGEPWLDDLRKEPQDYLVVPQQRWLDGFHVGDAVVRQFVAVPAGKGLTVEEQLNGHFEHGGLQLLIRPMGGEEFERYFPVRRPSRSLFCVQETGQRLHLETPPDPGLGLGPGGRARQGIAVDPYGPAAFTSDHWSRCFVHLLNASAWRAVTGERPTTAPITPQAYAEAGYPWFDDYEDDADHVRRSIRLKRLVGLGGGGPISVTTPNRGRGSQREQVSEPAPIDDANGGQEP